MEFDEFSQDQKNYITMLIEEKLDVFYDKILNLDKQNSKWKIFNLKDYGFTDRNFDFERYIVMKSNLITDIKEAFFNRYFIVLQYKEMYWTLNSFQNMHGRFNFSFINIGTEQEPEPINEYQFPMIQFILVMENPDEEAVENMIMKKSNLIRLSSKILTDNSVFEEEVFSEMENQLSLFKENHNGFEV